MVSLRATIFTLPCILDFEAKLMTMMMIVIMVHGAFMVQGQEWPCVSSPKATASGSYKKTGRMCKIRESEKFSSICRYHQGTIYLNRPRVFGRSFLVDEKFVLVRNIIPGRSLYYLL